jgi:hypothetical protein
MNFLKILGIILSIALLCSAATAATENKDLPTEKQITDYLSGLQPGNFVTSASEASLKAYPEWKWDTWTDTTGNTYISFYHTSNNLNGYGSLYYDNYGKKLNNVCYIDLSLIKSYKGESVKEEVVIETPVIETETPEETVTVAPVIETETPEEAVIDTPEGTETPEEEVIETPVIEAETPEETVTEAPGNNSNVINSMSKESKMNLLMELIKSLFGE